MSWQAIISAAAVVCLVCAGCGQKEGQDAPAASTMSAPAAPDKVTADIQAGIERHIEEQVRLGRMSESEALRSPLRNVITRALGTQNCVTPDCFGYQADPGDVFMLCTDGLTRELTDQAIESILDSSLPLPDRCARLVEAAKRAGGHDNITCMLVQAMI